ncbi:MAG: hypothetical protein ACOCYR_01130 [Erythrobacter sp.]|uniref:hypothetical protein n=1 Tax=Erythrobacter sp. HL-111 TaxID=1798193 RepID=UPI0012F903E9|nr:hypothetical protein [Erythrobacter sp. HL-111]
MITTISRARSRPKLSLRFGAEQSPAPAQRTPAKPAIPTADLRRLVAAMVD